MIQGNNNDITTLQPYYETEMGKAYLGDTLNIIKHIPDNSINLVLTSPSFALTSQKEYGNKQEQEYINWFLQFSADFKRVLTSDGSTVCYDLKKNQIYSQMAI